MATALRILNLPSRKREGDVPEFAVRKSVTALP